MKTKINDIGLAPVLAFLALLFFGATTITAAPGDLDPTFGQDGRVLTNIAVPGYTYFYPNTESMLVQPDGKILVCGRFWEDRISYWYGTFIVRYMPNGTLDSSFGENGKVAVVGAGYPYGNQAVGADMALQRDGKILLIGQYTIADGIIVQRYTSSGMLDVTFGTNGTTLVPRGESPAFPEGTSITLQPDGKIVGVGWEYRLTQTFPPSRIYEAIVVFRINTDGSMDNTFGSAGNGVTTLAYGYDLPDILIQPDGKIIVVGTLDHRPAIWPTILLARYNPDGSLDSSFGTGGKVTHRINDQDSFSNGAALQPDGKIVVTGGYYSGSESHPIMVRYNPSGSLDTGFGANGIVSMESGLFGPNSVLVQTDGKIIATGNAYDNATGHNGFAIVRLNSSGSLDPSFGVGGRSVFPINAGGTNYAYASDGALQPDGRILVTGYFGYYYTDSHETIALIRVDGGQHSCPNPIDCADSFVRQHYLDFLNREPEPGGLAYWTGQITQCGSDPVCVHNRRIDVSAEFFLSVEFQQTGSFVYGLYKGALGRQPTYPEFTVDHNRVIGGTNLEDEKAALANDFVQRPEFLQHYPGSMTNTQYVNSLFDTAGLFPFTAERQAEIDAMNNLGRTRAQVLRNVIDIQAFRDREFNPSFVLMQYFGYMRRDIDPGGYNYWLVILNSTNNYRGMVCNFINSWEYQLRFGAVTQINADCSQ